MGHSEKNLLMSYTSRSIPSSGTSRGTDTDLLHIQVHSILWETSRGTVTHLLHIQVHTLQWDIQRNSYSPATHPGPYHPVGHPEEQLFTYYTSRPKPSSGTSRGTVTHLLHTQVHTSQWDIQRNSFRKLDHRCRQDLCSYTCTCNLDQNNPRDTLEIESFLNI